MGEPNELTREFVNAFREAGYKRITIGGILSTRTGMRVFITAWYDKPKSIKSQTYPGLEIISGYVRSEGCDRYESQYTSLTPGEYDLTEED